MIQNQKLVATMFCAAIFLVGCGGDERAAKKVVLENLKDADSAKFGKFALLDEKYACLTVNAKNSMGGYTGDQQAFLKKIDGEWQLFFIEETSQEMCIDMWPKIDK
jgi:hypothetical protein